MLPHATRRCDRPWMALLVRTVKAAPGGSRDVLAVIPTSRLWKQRRGGSLNRRVWSLFIGPDKTNVGHEGQLPFLQGERRGPRRP